MFTVLDGVRDATLRLVSGANLEMNEAQRFDLAVLNRGINLLEASRMLLAGGHWEAASSSARQLFELLVNLEYIHSQPNRDEACSRYQKYALMQYANRVLREIEYDRATGRPVDEPRAEVARKILASPDLAEFKDKKGKWKRSWSGLDARALARKSSNPMREKQWEMAFVTWSEETHAAPVALLDAMRARGGDSWIDDKVAEDDREVGQMILMLVTFFLELCSVLPSIPTPDLDSRLRWTDALMAEVRARGQHPD